MYRLAADVFNDTAMVFDCFSPALPKAPRVLLLGLSSVLRALCGVAAGSSKASLSAHFAKWGNLGELNAVSPPSFYFLGGQLDIAWKGHQPPCPHDTKPLRLRHDLQRCRLRIAAGCLLIVQQKDSSQETVISLLGYVQLKILRINDFRLSLTVD